MVPARPARRACQHAAGDCSVGYRASGWLTLPVSSEGKPLDLEHSKYFILKACHMILQLYQKQL
jgi:hypothetical protein